MVKTSIKWAILVVLVIALGVPAFRFFYRVKVTQTRAMLGTEVTVTVLVHNRVQGEKWLREIYLEIERLEKIYSDRRPDSELTRVNQQAAKEWVHVSTELAETINDAFYWHEKSGGLFDITVGSLGQAWGFKTEGLQQKPDPIQLQGLVDKVGLDKVEWDRTQTRIRFKNSSIQLDLGGIAKLAILRQLDDYLRQRQFYEFLINLGGDVLAGQRGIVRKWQVGISDPKQPDTVALQLEVEDSLVLTSGDYFRYFSKDGQVYHHIFDPTTGLPCKTMNAVTLVMPSVQPDPLPSIVVFLLGPVAGLELINNQLSVEGVIVKDGKWFYSPGFHRFETR